MCHGADGDVECAIALSGDFLRRFEHTEKIAAHAHGTIMGGAADLIQLAVRLVIGELLVELANARKRRGHSGRVRRMDDDPKQRAHVRLNSFEPLRACGGNHQKRAKDPSQRHCSSICTFPPQREF